MGRAEDLFRASSPFGGMILGATTPTQPSPAPEGQNFFDTHVRPNLTLANAARVGLPIAGGALGTLIPIPGVGTAAGAAIGSALGAGLGGAVGEVAAESLEGQPLDPTEIGLSGLLSAVPAGPIGRLAAKPGLRLLARAGLHAGEGAAQGVLAEGVHTRVKEGRLPTLSEIGRGALGGAVLGGTLGTGLDVALRGPRVLPDLPPARSKARVTAGLDPAQPPQQVVVDPLQPTPLESPPPIQEGIQEAPLPTEVAEQRLGDRRLTEIPVEEDRRLVERRAQLAQEVGLPPEHPAVRMAVEAEQRAVAAETDPVTGLPGRAAYNREVAAHQGAIVSLDADGLKFINEGLGGGHAAGDAFLKALGDAVKAEEGAGLKGFRAGESGDEIYILAPTPEAGEEFGARLRERFQKAIFRFTTPDGVVREYTGGQVSHGVAPIAEPGPAGAEAARLAADLELKERRGIAAGLGRRDPARGSRPLGLVEVSPAGEQVRGDLAPAPVDTAPAPPSRIPIPGTVKLPTTFSKPPKGPRVRTPAQEALAQRQAVLLQDAAAAEDFPLAPAAARQSVRPTRAFDAGASKPPSGGGTGQTPPPPKPPSQPPTPSVGGEPPPSRLKEAAIDAISLPRSLLSSIDMSAPLRQGLLLTVSHPAKAASAFGEMVKSFVSQKSFDKLKTEIIESPNARVHDDSGLYVSMKAGESVSGREEAFVSKWIKKIPGVRGSERAYSTYLDKLRTDVFDSSLKAMQDAGNDDPTLAKSLARYINHATGRGDLGSLNQSAVLLNTLFFSPRFMAARLQMFNPVFYAKLAPEVRKKALGDMLKLAGVGVTLASLAKMGGADVELDPRSNDFGKIRFGKTRFDIWGGFQPWVRFFSQLATGERKKLSGSIANESRLSIAGRFAGQKLSPQASLVVDLLRGETALGEKLSIPQQAYERLVPLFLQDLKESIEQNPEMALAGGLAGFFGASVQTYAEPAQPTPMERFLQDELDRLGWHPEEPSNFATIRGRRVDLEPEEQRLLKKANMRAADEARRLIRSSQYRRLSDEDREYELKRVFEKWRSKGYSRIRRGVQARFKAQPRQPAGPPVELA